MALIPIFRDIRIGINALPHILAFILTRTKENVQVFPMERICACFQQNKYSPLFAETQESTKMNLYPLYLLYLIVPMP